MEEVLEVYKREYDSDYPLLCFDESNKEQHIEVITPLPMESGEPERFESTDERNGVSTLFMFFAPLHNWRAVKVTVSLEPSSLDYYRRQAKRRGETPAEVMRRIFAGARARRSMNDARQSGMITAK